MFLVGDIGGTYTRLALIKGSGKNIIYEKSFLTKDFKTLEKVVGSFLKGNKTPLLAACFGVAGVVRRGKCLATNFPWAVDENVLRGFLKIEKVFLISDLQAKACGLSLLEERDFFVVNEGQFELGNAAIVAPGTGLGVAGLAFGGKRNIPFATEAGHVDFAPRNEMEAKLLFYLQKKHENVSCERVVSGMGIYNIYRFLVDEGFETKEKIVEAEVLKNDPPVVIYKYRKTYSSCKRTIEMFLSLFGAFAGNAALQYLAVSGVYLAGGIILKLHDELEGSDFLSSFVKKGRFSKFNRSIPVKVILDDKIALYGCYNYILGY